MRKLLRLKNLLIFASIGSFIGIMLFLFIEAFVNSNFRTTQDKILSMKHVNLTGLRELKASGGTSVRFLDLKRRLRHVKDPIVIIDGIDNRHEYIYGIPTTFFAYHNPRPHLKYYIRRWVFTGSPDVRWDLAVPEAMEAQKNGFSYVNIKVGSKYISSPDAIDELVRVFDNLPANSWVHFHCHYGKGRTSMMLVMYDIMKNAPQVPLEDIIKRQHLLGSEDLLSTVIWKKGSYTKKQLEERIAFITSFYNFICQRKAGGIQKWSEWHK